MATQAVKLKIRSIQSGMDDDKMRTEQSLEGFLETTKDLVRICYTEDLSQEGDRVHTTLSYAYDHPEIIHLNREGSVRMSCIFEQGQRYICNYELPIGAMEFTVATSGVKNHISYREGGTLDMRYAMESRGVVLQKTDYHLTVIME